MNKKSFFTGLITGLVISLFMGCIAMSVSILMNGGNNKKNARENNNTNLTTATVSNSKEETKSSGETLVEDNTAKDGYVLQSSGVTQKIMVLEDLIDNYYVEPITNETLANGIYEGMMASIDDPYAAYYSPEDYQKLLSSTEGVYYGVGAYLQKDTEYLYPRITGIIANSPVEESSLRVDDFIVAVDGVDVYDWDLSEAVALIKGDEGTEVTLSIVRRSTGEAFDETLVRRKVESPTVTYEKKENGIAYIQISEFDTVTVGQFAEALAKAKADNMKGLILDLRGNPGGSVSAVVDIAGMILPKGVVVYTEDKHGNKQEYKSPGKHPLDVPMVVLVDGNSASSAEILAGAIKDYGIGTLMGTTTFGKGIVQRIVGLEDGSAAKLTVSHYYTPKGNDIHKVGIEPDVEVKFDSESYIKDKNNDNQLDAAIEYLMDEFNK